MLCPSAGHSSTMIGNTMLVFGGFGGSKWFDEVDLPARVVVVPAASRGADVSQPPSPLSTFFHSLIRQPLCISHLRRSGPLTRTTWTGSGQT